MTKQTLKVGNGRVHGVSNYSDQQGKMLTLFDGATVLCHIPLDKAFPSQTIIMDGIEQIAPGMLLDVAFVNDLHVECDGIVDVYWQA